jgi:GPI inositol-deacylase
VPWQVGFLGCWIYHLYTCASQPTYKVPDVVAIPLVPRETDDLNEDHPSPPPSLPPASFALSVDTEIQNQREHLLLLMTWLLPLAAPVLAVWVRTLFTAGFTTPFDGDHNTLYVMPFLILVDPVWGISWMYGCQPGKQDANSGWRPKARWMMLVLAVVAFMWGPRYTYIVFEAASFVLTAGIVLPLLRRFNLSAVFSMHNRR